jgi:hypothetical protein
METFTEPRDFVNHPRYSREREDALAALDLGSIDAPIVDIIAGFAKIPHCFTLQSCYGHFVCAAEQDPRTLDPIPRGHTGPVRYRIAYVAFCLENSPRGRALRESLARIPAIEPAYVQFGTPDWHWNQLSMVNTYALQVEPIAHQLKDEAVLEPEEARCTEGVRDRFFTELRAVLASELSQQRTKDRY